MTASRALAIVHQRDAGPGVFADAMPAQRGVELDTWLRGRGNAARASRAATTRCWSSAARCTPTTRTPIRGCATRRRCWATCSSAGRRCSASASARSSSPRRPVRRPRRASEPEIGWHEVELTAEGRGDPLLGAARAALRRPSSGTATSSRCRRARRRSRAAPSACRPSGSATRAWGIQFHAEVTAADAEAWIDDYRSDEDAVRIGVDPERAARAHPRARSAPGTSSAARSASASWSAARYSGVT